MRWRAFEELVPRGGQRLPAIGQERKTDFPMDPCSRSAEDTSGKEKSRISDAAMGLSSVGEWPLLRKGLRVQVPANGKVTPPAMFSHPS